MNRAQWNVRVHLLLLAWIVAEIVVVLMHRSIPAAPWLMVHGLLLGVASTAIVIWGQHFADTMLSSPSPGGRRLHVVRLAMLTVGAVLVFGGMLGGWVHTIEAGAAVVTIAAIIHVVILVMQTRRALPTRFGGLVRYYVVATLCLPIGVGLGVAMARISAGNEAYGRMYVAHVGITLLGWIGLTVLGTLVLLWPTVLHARIQDGVGAAARRLLYAFSGTLVVIGLGALVGQRVVAALGFAGFLVATVILSRYLYAQALQVGRLGVAGAFLAMSVAWLMFCTALAAIVVAVADSWEQAQTSLGDLVAPFLVGFCVQILMGALTYLIPVVVGSGRAARRAAEDALHRGGYVRLFLFNGGLAVYLLPLPSWVRVALSLVVFGAIVMTVIAGVRAAARSRKIAALEVGARARGEVPEKIAARNGPSGSGGSLVGAATVAVLVLSMTVVAGVSVDPVSAGVGSSTGSVGASGTHTGSTVAETGDTTTVQVEMVGMRFVPDTIEVPTGNRLVIELSNSADQVHDLVVDNGSSSGRLAPGESVTVDVGVIPGNLDGWCSIAGHALMGMRMEVVATGGDGTAAAEGDDAATMDHSAMGGTPSAPSAADAIDLEAAPADGFAPFEAALAPAPDATVHRETFRVQEVEREVAPGVSQMLWTFGGTAPGPVLRGKVGDRFEITLINDGTMGHSIDFHAGELAPDEPMRTIAPGESLTYSFTATHAGIWMYHCSTAPMSLHIANGMFGAVIIDPADLAPVDREYVLLQSEMYLGPEGEPGDYAKIQEEAPDLVVFNGYANGYAHQPLPAVVGERVRVWVLNPGPNRASSFHVVGEQFDTTYFEGNYTLRPGGDGASQALGLMPAQGGFVEMEFGEAGNYPFVSHVMVDAERGAKGIFAVEP